MKKVYLIFSIVFVLLSCSKFTSSPQPPFDNPTPTFTKTSTQTRIPNLTPTPIFPVAIPTISPALDDRPAFLSWPLPSYIGTNKIEQYPNTPWTWNHLGLNEGQQCPPPFANFIYPYLYPYWRDESIPREQDIAQADPHGFAIVLCYSTDTNVGANGHAGTDIETNVNEKTPVYAAADGKVMQWRLSGWNSMIVLKHCLGGTWNIYAQCTDGKQWYTTYMHIIPNPEFLVKDKDVKQGTQIAQILNLAERTHLHFEVGLESRSFANFVNPWGEDSYPWLGCLWIDQRLCASPNLGYKHSAFYSASERLFIKHGSLRPIEIYDAQGIKKIRLLGEQIALIDSNNRLLYRERILDGYGESLSVWSLLAENVLDFQLTKTRIGIMDESQNLFFKENESNNTWSLQVQDIKSFSISENRIGYLLNNGDLHVREGRFESEWILIAQYIQAFQLTDNRLAIVDVQGNMYVNEGKFSAGWEHIGNKIKAFQLTNSRLGIINAENILFVKEGGLRSNWVILAENVQSFQLADDRVLIVDNNGEFKLKEGNLYQGWYVLPYAELKSVILNGDLSVFVP